MKDRKGNKITKLTQKGRLHFLKLFTEMQRVYLLDIAKHTYPDEYLEELEERLKRLQDMITEL